MSIIVSLSNVHSKCNPRPILNIFLDFGGPLSLIVIGDPGFNPRKFLQFFIAIAGGEF
jgi:hypothetical protein